MASRRLALLVPVGEDQVPHVELSARDGAELQHCLRSVDMEEGSALKLWRRWLRD